jgi:hypothetical protein
MTEEKPLLTKARAKLANEGKLDLGLWLTDTRLPFTAAWRKIWYTHEYGTDKRWGLTWVFGRTTAWLKYRDGAPEQQDRLISKTLRSDVFLLLDGKKQAKSANRIRGDLVEFCGWNKPPAEIFRRRVWFPPPTPNELFNLEIGHCLHDLKDDGLVDSALVDGVLKWWRK